MKEEPDDSFDVVKDFEKARPTLKQRREKKKSIAWTEEEHEKFLTGCQLFGKNW